MIEEVVNSILEAEDVAAQRVAQAKEEASEIISAAQSQADTFRKQSSLQNKDEFAAASRQAEETAQKAAAQKLAEINAETDKEIASYQKNIDKAVKIILENLL